MKKLAILLLAAAVFLCSCGSADIVVRSDMRGAKTTDFGTATKAPPETDGEGMFTVVINRSSGVFHISGDCYSAGIMKEENRLIKKYADVAQAVSDGYKPCGVCAKEYIKEN